ncbi:MAG: hypothetical protein CML43_02940 [Rhodobacteraceae bacterium]|nr:hypothetical protein [Paracoccaceae bacterium]
MSTLPLSQRLARLAPPEPAAAPNTTVIRRTIDRVLDAYGRPAPRDPDPERLLKEMARRISEWSWAETPLSFALEAAEAAFSPDFRGRADIEPVRRFFLEEAKVSERPALLDALARIYVESFDALAEHTRHLAGALRLAVERLGAQWRKLLENFPNLLDPAKAAQEIAECMAALPDIWTGLKSLGLRQPHGPGLMAQAHLDFLGAVGPRLTRREEVERLFEWLKPPGQPALVAGAGQAIAALLRPWRDSGVPEDLKKLTTQRLLDLYGHPKVNRNPIWNDVPEALEGLFLHWLAGADIRMLFAVLKEVERGHMWADREDFWWSLYEQERISEVWVAFNRDGHRAALSRIPRDQRHGAENLRFALQRGEKDKSLLFMRIGDKIVVEGTFNFKVHIFETGSKHAPALYRPDYDVSNIRRRRNATAIPHLGNWQAKVLMEL